MANWLVRMKSKLQGKADPDGGCIRLTEHRHGSGNSGLAARSTAGSQPTGGETRDYFGRKWLDARGVLLRRSQHRLFAALRFVQEVDHRGRSDNPGGFVMFQGLEFLGAGHQKLSCALASARANR